MSRHSGRAASSHRLQLQRRRRQLLLRRVADHLTGWLLGLLVVGGMGLGGLLWFGPHGLESPGLGAAAGTYQASDAQSAVPPEVLARPEQIQVLFGGGEPGQGLSDSGDPNYLAVWDAVQQLMLSVTPGEIARVQDLGFKTFMRDLDAMLQGPGGAHGAFAVDATLGPTLPWADWMELLGARAWTGAASTPQVNRIVVLDQPGDPPQLFLLNGALVGEVVLTSAQVHEHVEPTVRNLQFSANLKGYSLVPLPGPLPPAVQEAVAVPQALLVPDLSAWKPQQGHQWVPYQLLSENLDPGRMARAIFPDPLDVTTGRPGANLRVYMNPQHWVLSVGGGEAALAVPQNRAAMVPDWYAGLQEVVAYVSRVGGWPSTAWLAGFQSAPASQCIVSRCPASALTYDFSVRTTGLPVLQATTGLPVVQNQGAEAMRLTISGSSGQPSQYTRQIPLAGDPLAVDAAPLGATSAVAQALRGVQVTAGQALQVVQVFPAMVSQPAARRLEPVWAVVLDSGTGGSPLTVLVDAYSR